MKTTKKILSVILAVMMVVSMLPMTALAKTVNSMENDNAKALLAQIDAYEAKMDGKHFYTNMTPAYSAYLMANRAYAGYAYGDVQGVDLAKYTNDLKNAIANMGTWTQPKITSATGTWPADGTSSGWANSGAYVNLAYAGSADADQVAKTTDVNNANKNTKFYIRYTPATMVYDGVTIPSMPVMTVLHGDSGKKRYFYSVVLTDNDGNSLYLDGNWKGKANSGNNWDYSYQRWDSSAGQDRVGTSTSSSTFAAQVANSGTFSSWSHEEGDTNYIHYNTEFAKGVYYKEITPTFMAYGGSNTSFTTTDIVMGGAANTKIAVINYKAIPDALSANISKLNLQGRKYAHGGATNLLMAYDAAMNFTVNLNGGNDYVACANQIKTLVETLNGADKTTDIPAYLDLRQAVKDTMSTYNSDAWESYTTDSWNTFTAAYEAAQAEYKYVYNSGFRTNSSEASKIQTIVNNLQTAKANLEVNVAKADTFIIENTIDDALVAVSNKNYFTSASYASANLEALTAQAQTEIWGAVASYKDKASVVSEDSQAMVDEWVVTIGEAIALLEINEGNKVGVAYGYSLNSALAEAATKVPEDYSNYVDLETAVKKAQKFEAKVITDTTDTSSFRTGIVQAKISEYENVVTEVAKALVNLHISFAKISDGEIANTQTGSTSLFGFGSNHSDGKYYSVGYAFPTETVIFKTTHDENTIALPNGSISFAMQANTQDKLAASFLDSVNINNDWSGETPEIKNGSDGSDSSLNDDQKATYNGNLQIGRQVNGKTYIYRVGNTSAIKGSGIFGATMSTGYSAFGVDSNGTQVTSSGYDFTTDLATTSGVLSNKDVPVPGSLGSRDSAVITTASTSLYIPASTQKTLTASTLPTYTTIPVADNSNFSALVEFKYPGLANRVYYGFTAKSVAYSQTMYVVDVAYLMDLIKECDALQRANYTTSSWDAFKAQIIAAKDEMNYGSMTAAEITAECEARYKALWNAKAALVEAATNDVIDDALTEATAIKNSGVKYTKTSLAVFNAAFDEAVAAINGAYTDDKCLDLIKSENQAAIDAIAKKLTDAIKTLDELADYTALENAYAALTTALNADTTYSVASLKNLKNVVEKAVYLYKTAEDKEDIGGSQQTAINAEATAINNAITALEAGTIDNQAFTAAEDAINKKATDPDAWTNVDAAKAYIENKKSECYEDVTILDVTLTGTKASQFDSDSFTTEVLSMVQPQEYTVYVNGVEDQTAAFGKEVTVNFAEESDVFYAYKSNVAGNVELNEEGKPEGNGKYYTTDSQISFVIKGDTWLTAYPTKNAEAQHKVTYVSGPNNKVIAIEYVADGADVEAIPEAPSYPYYTFTGYTVDGVAFTGKNITADTTVVANYNQEESTITITYFDDTADNCDEDGIVERICAYNEKVDLSYDDAAVWAKFDDVDSLINWSRAEGDYTYEIVCAGDAYTFYACEDVYIAPVIQEYLDDDIDAGMVSSDAATTPTVTTATNYVDATTKISFISSYYDAGYELVEAGILVAKKAGLDLTDITKTTVDGNQVYRLKSSQHTAGNQFVISLSTKSMPNGQDFTVTSYMIYKDADGNQQVIYGNNEYVTYTK